jgi:hypothetical protein
MDIITKERTCFKRPHYILTPSRLVGLENFLIHIYVVHMRKTSNTSMTFLLISPKYSFVPIRIQWQQCLVGSNGELCWNFRTIHRGEEPSRNRVVVPARHYICWRNDSLESIPGLLKSLKIPSLRM